MMLGSAVGLPVAMVVMGRYLRHQEHLTDSTEQQRNLFSELRIRAWETCFTVFTVFTVTCQLSFPFVESPCYPMLCHVDDRGRGRGRGRGACVV